MKRKVRGPKERRQNDPLPDALEANLKQIDYDGFDPELFDSAASREDLLRLWGDANEPLRAVMLQIGEHLVGRMQKDLRVRHQLAGLFKKLLDDRFANGEQLYGPGALHRVCRFFGLKFAGARAFARLAQTFSAPEVEALASARLPGGHPVNRFHLDALALVDDRVQRRQLAERVLAEGTDPVLLAKEIRELNRRERKAFATGGRPVSAPRDLDALLYQQVRPADDFLARVGIWGHPAHRMLTRVSDLPEEECTLARAEQMQAHAAKLRKLAEEVIAQAEEAEQARGLILQRVGAGEGKCGNPGRKRSEEPELDGEQ